MVSFEYYRFFYFVAQYKSFTKAAEILNNNQPNITRCMNILENELECKLFVRSNRGVTLTPEGEKLFQHVAIAYEQLSTAESELKKDKSLESGLITIGASETALRLLLLDRLETFHAQYPGVRLKISNFSTPQSIQALENGLADISVVTTPLKLKKSMRHYTLASFREILLAGPKYADFSSKISQSLRTFRLFLSDKILEQEKCISITFCSMICRSIRISKPLPQIRSCR